MNNTLIDNSENLKMADTLKKCISNDNCKVIKIATGYWDIPGFMLVGEELRRFLEKDGRELQLLIGTDPIVRAYQQESVRKGRFPEDYIKTDINDLKLKKEYMGRRGKISEKTSGRISVTDRTIRTDIADLQAKGMLKTEDIRLPKTRISSSCSHFRLLLFRMFS